MDGSPNVVIKGMCTRVEAQSAVVTAPHAGDRVCDGVHVGGELHGAQRVTGGGVVHNQVVFQIAL